MAIHESGEDYLEAILMIKKRNGNVRSIDIAHELSFSKPSVSVAMKNLKASNYITIDENGFINLTETGQEIADKIYERHIPDFQRLNICCFIMKFRIWFFIVGFMLPLLLEEDFSYFLN